MFWNFNQQTPSAIDVLLSKDDCTLSQLLDEDDVLQVTRASKIFNFPSMRFPVVGM